MSKIEMAIYNERVIQMELDNIMMDDDATPEQIEAKIDALVQANTGTVESLQNTIPFMLHLDDFVERCKREKDRINEREKWAKKITDKFDQAVTSYLAVKGLKKLDVDTFKLSLRASTQTVITDEELLPKRYNDYKYCIPGELRQEIMLELPVTMRMALDKCFIESKPNKPRIKADIEDNFDVPGAALQLNDNLQIK